MPGRRTRKSKAPKAGTRLVILRNQKDRAADAWGMQVRWAPEGVSVNTLVNSVVEKQRKEA